MALFRRGKPAETRPFVASARPVKIGDRTEVERTRRLRQSWQQDAWVYRDSIGEVRYPLEFMANAITRMRIYPALQVDPDEPPVKLDEADGVPPGLVATALADLQALGSGTAGLRPLLSSHYVNSKVAGEMWLVGYVDPLTDEETWSIRSIDELILDDAGDVWIRDDPSASQGTGDLQRLDRDTTYVSRIWTPHKRFRALADSPMRAVLDSCEELLLLSRSIRGSARSRLAGAGLLLIAQELSLRGVIPSTDDDEADPFMAELTEAMLTPISDEGDSSAVVPIIARVPGEMLKEGKAAQLIHFDRPIDQYAMQLRQELIERIATGLDLPKEVVTGAKDLNHWSKWAVDDDTFRHHIEPDVISTVDGLTVAYTQPMLEARGEWDPALIRRVCLWYDPVELVTHPDRTADAQQTFDRGGIGRHTLRGVSGFTDDDMPDEVDEALYVIGHSRGAPPEVVTALVRRVAPNLNIVEATAELTAPPAGAGSEPAAPATAEPRDQPGVPATPGADGPPVRPTVAAVEVLPATAACRCDGAADGHHYTGCRWYGLLAEWPDSGPGMAATTDGQEPLVAAPARRSHGGASRKLLDIDRQLRARLLTACDAAVRRQLDRAGARLRSRAQRDPALRAALAAVPQTQVAMTLGREQVATFGVTDSELVDGDWTLLREQWNRWVARAQQQARQVAVQITGTPADDAAVAELAAAQDTALGAGWDVLAAALSGLTAARIWDPHPDAPPLGEHDDTLTVPASTIREAVAVAGGADGTASTDLPAGAFGIGNGQDVSDFILAGDVEVEHRIWRHGDVEREFEPHGDLDGYTFVDFDDDGLVNTTGWPEVAYYSAGDHDGCSCDWEVVYVSAAAEEPIAAAGEPGAV